LIGTGHENEPEHRCRNHGQETRRDRARERADSGIALLGAAPLFCAAVAAVPIASRAAAPAAPVRRRRRSLIGCLHTIPKYFRPYPKLSE